MLYHIMEKNDENGKSFYVKELAEGISPTHGTQDNCLDTETDKEFSYMLVDVLNRCFGS